MIGVISDRRMLGPHAFHMVGEKYLNALVDCADGYPVGIPSLAEGFDVLDILDRLDGLFLTGSPSNMEPHHYLGEPSRAGTWHDPERDAAALALIPAAIRAGMPLFAVCRGFQEMNVAFGGSLHQHVDEVPGFHKHKENDDEPLEVQYAPAHPVTFTRRGMLEKITGERKAQVNSLHGQGVNRLGSGLQVEATADDGLVEAFTVTDSPGFTLALQWHPEWKATSNPVSMAIYRAFGEACRTYRLREIGWEPS